MKFLDTGPFLLAGALALAAHTAAASCGDRPGTPDIVSAKPLGTDRIQFDWRNTTGRRASGSGETHSMWFDISVRDGNGNMVGLDRTGTGPYNVMYRSQSSTDFSGLAPGTTLCLQIRARTKPKTEGCVSEIFSAKTCATTPTPSIDQVCRSYAATAYAQLMNINRMERSGACSNWPNEARWSSDWSQHYAWCVNENLGNRRTHLSEEQARNNVLKSCRLKVAASPKQPPPPPTASLAPNFACRVGVSMRLAQCLNSTGGEMTEWDYRGLSPACGLGENEEQATANAVAAYASIGVIAGEEAVNGGCAYESKTINGCSCDPGLTTMSYRPRKPLKPITVVPHRPTDVAPLQVPSGGGAAAAAVAAAATCKAGFVWRTARPEDLVCVPPSSRSRVGRENRLGPANVVPGTNTCKTGFVWRNAFDGDGVCVTPQARETAAIENRLGPQRRAVAR